MEEKLATDRKSGRRRVVTAIIPSSGRNTPNSSLPSIPCSLLFPPAFTACSFIRLRLLPLNHFPCFQPLSLHVHNYGEHQNQAYQHKLKIRIDVKNPQAVPEGVE